MAKMLDPNEPYRTTIADDGTRNPPRFDSELQPDPELAEGSATGGRIAAYTLGIAVLLGAVFYGLNNSSMTSSDPAKTASQSTPAQTAAPKAPSPTNNIADNNNDARPAVPPGVRDVTPYNNSNNQPGVTTGAAPSRPTAPQSAPTGPQVDSAKGGAPK